MRALGRRLDVEAMSLYNHVRGKEGLREGIAELLWQEVERSFQAGSSWRDSLRSLARSLRALANDHPHAFPLLMSSASMVAPMLRAFGAGLGVLREAGFDGERATLTLNAVTGYAAGYAAMELSCLAACGTQEGEEDLDAIVRLTQTLPPEASPDLIRVAHECWADPDVQFEFGLEALLAGIDPV